MDKLKMLALLPLLLLFSGCISAPDGPLVLPVDPPQSINSFEECAAAGYPIMESYPRQCAVPGGPSFTEVFSEAECARHDVDFCPGNCVVCPPCVECSSIGCHSEEFCTSIGFSRGWYQETQMGGGETCVDQCGNGICEEIVCMAIGCPCAETQESCPQDCT